MHAWDSSVPLEETLRTFDDLIRNGKVRYIGASNLKGWQLQKMVDISKYMGLHTVISLQVNQNISIGDTHLVGYTCQILF